MPRETQDSARRRLSIPLALVLAFALGTLVGPRMVGADTSEASPFQNLSIFARALAHIEASYVEEVDQDALIHGAIRGMVGSLDPHTVYLDPDEYRSLTADTQGQFAGIGVEITVRDGWLIVLAVFDDGPADGAGLLPGDKFLHIAGRPARDMRISDAVRLMRGEPGTTVRVGIRREGQEDGLDLNLTRALIEVNPIQALLLPDRVLYIKLGSFQDNTTSELRAAIDSALGEVRGQGGLSGLILDMRNNPGGLVRQAVLVCDEFLTSGTIVSTRGRDGRLLDESSAHSRGTRPEWPMVVLVNGYTASAAEIVAGALRDHERALIIGTRTWGKGSVQNIIELPDGGAMKLTIARYYTPSGVSIQAQGIEPDVVVAQLSPTAVAAARLESEEQLREASLSRHLEGDGAAPEAGNVLQREEAREGATEEDRPPFSDDYQARMAHQTLRAIIADRTRRE